MGFERNKTYVLAFDGTDYEGLEVRARGASVAGLMRAVDLATLLDGGKLGSEDMTRIDTLFRIFAGCPALCVRTHEELADSGREHYANKILSWNLTEDGQPISADYEGLMSQDIEFASDLVMAWLDGVVGTPGPLGDSLSAGTPSVEELMSMAMPSPVHPN